MSARPGEWHLVGHDADPLPGDSVSVEAEATHYSGVASTISEQVARLRALSEYDGELVGQYAEGLRESCSELADHLDRAHDRFATVGAQLAKLAPALHEARVKTYQALQDAESAQQRMNANSGGSDVPAADMTQAQKDAEEAREGRFTAAQGDLGAARTACSSALSAYDGVADPVASEIRSAADDDLKDSTWDKFKDFVHSISPVVSFIADALAIIATVLTIAALFIPGINLLVIAALMAGALLLHSLLAATGNGSWVDVAFDALGLVTLGAGSLLGGLARAGRSATLARAGTQAGNRASAAVFQRAAFNNGSGLLGRASMFVVKRLPWVRTRAATAYADEFARVVNRPMPTVSRLEAIRAGFDEGGAAMLRDYRAIRSLYGAENVTRGFTVGSYGNVGVSQAGALADMANYGLGGFNVGPVQAYEVPPYEEFKDRMTVEVGGPW